MNPQDPQDMLSYIDALPDDLEKAWKLGQEFELPAFNNLKKVCIAGMGGSAIGGDFLAAYLSDECRLPILSWRNYGLPSWADGEECLVICSSHSGNTEETLSAFETAKERGCQILAFCTGGELERRAKDAGVPAWIFEHHGQPRTAIPFSFGILLALFVRLGLAEFDLAELEEAVALMRAKRASLSASAPLAVNPARRLAGQLIERNIIILAAGANEVLARRWKGQIAELAKAFASYEALPEMNHNTLAGLVSPMGLFEKTSAIFLQSASDHPRNQIRIEHTMGQFLVAGMAVDSVMAEGQSRLAQMWTLLQFGDYLAYYLALNYGVDPTPIDALIALKEKLAAK